jgi:hypothetical protein
MSAALEYVIAESDQESVEQFIERLFSLDRDRWLAIASATERESESRPEATAFLDALVAHHGLGVQAWDIADDVETAMYCSLGPQGLESRRDAPALRLARQAASAAALALLVRPLLHMTDFQTLFQPFASLASMSL